MLQLAFGIVHTHLSLLVPQLDGSVDKVLFLIAILIIASVILDIFLH